MTQHVAHRASDQIAQQQMPTGIAQLSRELFDVMRFSAARGLSKHDVRTAADIAMLRMFGMTPPKDGSET